jgi:hypothetical protein
MRVRLGRAVTVVRKDFWQRANLQETLVSLLELSESERGCDNSIATGGSLDTHCRRHVLKVTLSVVWSSAPDREVNSVKLHVIPRLVRRVSARAVSSPISHQLP